MAKRITEKKAGWKIEVEYVGDKFKTFYYAPDRFEEEKDAEDRFWAIVGSDWVYANLYRKDEDGRWGLPITGHMA